MADIDQVPYFTHMKRFIEVHRKHANPRHAEILIELERIEMWEKNGGMVDECPSLMDILAEP